MKKMYRLVFAAVLLVILGAGCLGGDDSGNVPDNSTDNNTANNTNNGTDNSTPGNGSNMTGDENILIVYYSRTGNTETVAEQIHNFVGGHMVKVETVTPYPEDYSDTTAQAQEELNTGYLPPISTRIDNIEQYDVIFFGYPIWWGDIPPAMMTFLSENDLSGKTIVPFCTHGGSGQARSIDDIREYSPNATIAENLVLSSSAASSSQETVNAWLEGLGFTAVA